MYTEGLKSMGERTDDLMTNVFMAYHVASDADFVRYININKDGYADDYYITTVQLMTAALNNYKVLLISVKWNAMSLE